MGIIRKISAVLMALSVLLATTGFSVRKHHCTITKETITSVTHAKNCCSTNDKQNCPKEYCPIGCCQDETEYIQINTEIPLTATTHEITPDEFVAVIQYCVLSSLFDQDNKASNKYLNYKPPLILQDIPVLIQSFLI